MFVRQIIKKMKKSPAFLGFLIVISLVIFFIGAKEIRASSNLINDKHNNQNESEVVAPKIINVKLERVYLDGDISEEMIEETIYSMEDIWSLYDDWKLVTQTEQQVHFRKYVDEISPLLKLDGYFGISEDGYLNIYKGKPNAENIIQSFFQINTEKLKSHQYHHLKEGIPVKTKENYKGVIQTFKKYAITKI